MKIICNAFEIPETRQEVEGMLDNLTKLMGSDASSQKYRDGYEIMNALRGYHSILEGFESLAKRGLLRDKDNEVLGDIFEMAAKMKLMDLAKGYEE